MTQYHEIVKKILLLIFLIIVTFILFSFRVTKVPPGINGDESGIGYNAALISKNLTDENNNFFPLFVFAKGSDWKQPVSIYTTALVFKIFGVSFWSLRVASILFVITSIIILYFLTREMFNFKFFIISFFVLITTPIIMIQSHLALENIAVLPFIFLWLLMIAKYEKTKKIIYLFLGGTTLGVGIYSYLGMRLIVPVLSLITLFYLRKDLKKSVYFLFGLIPFFILLYVANFYYPGAVVGHYNGATQSVNDFLFRYLSTFDLSFMFLKGDVTAYHSTGKAGMFLVASLPLFIMGVGRILKDKKPFEMLILSSFFLAPFLFGLIPDIYRASRLLALIPFYTIIVTIGFFAAPKKFGFVILILMTINYFFFVKDYWFDYPERVKEVFSVPIDKTYEFRIKQ